MKLAVPKNVENILVSTNTKMWWHIIYWTNYNFKKTKTILKKHLKLTTNFVDHNRFFETSRIVGNFAVNISDFQACSGSAHPEKCFAILISKLILPPGKLPKPSPAGLWNRAKLTAGIPFWTVSRY